MILRECEHCGASLDPEERCDCQDKAVKIFNYWSSITKSDKNGQLVLKEIANG